MFAFRSTAAVALLAASAWAHDVFPASITLRPGGEDFVYVADQGTCPASITITSTNPAAVKVFAINMNSGAVVGGNGTTASVPNRVDQVFVVRASANLTANDAAVLQVCWVGADFPNAPCSENNCNPFFPHNVSVSVVLNPETAGAALSGSFAGDPVSAGSGELFVPHDPDLDLGGPMPLYFRRYYASRLQAEGNSTSTLGPNWSHNFAWRLVTLGHNVEVISDTGRAIRFERGFLDTAWSLAVVEDIPYQLIESGADKILADPLDERRYTFASNGRLTSIADGRGNTHTLSYTGGGLLQSVVDGLGRTLTFTHASGRMTMVTDGTRTTTFGYDGAQRLTSVTDAALKTTNYAYSTPSSALLASVMRPEGNVPYSQTYDGSDRVATQTDALGNMWSFAYVPSSKTTTITDPAATTRVHDHNADGALTSWSDEGGSSATMANDADGRRTRVTDRLGASTSWTIHAASGKIASTTQADGRVTTYGYTPRLSGGFTFHDLTAITYPDSTTESLGYDANGNRTSWADREGDVWSYTYNGRGQVTQVTNPESGATGFTYNADGTLATTTDAANNTTTFGYDALRRITSASYADMTMRSYTYDAMDRVLTTTDEESEVTTFTYDDNGNLETIVDPSIATWTFGYDGLDRLQSILNPLGHVATATYDDFGRVDSLTDGSGRALTLGYDARGRLNSASKGVGGVWTTTHNLEGVPTASTDPTGATNSIVSNNMGRITSWTSELGLKTNIGYDAFGRVKTIGDAAGFSWTLNYNGRGELSSLVSPIAGASASFTRNGLGQVTQVGLPGGSTWQTDYDDVGRAIAQIDPLGRTTTYSYNPRNRVDTVTYPGTLGTATYEYDLVGKLSRRLYSSGLDLSYTYDPNGRLTGTQDVALGYDTAGRMTSSNGMTMAYDDAGRVTAATLGVGMVVNYAYDARGLCSSLTDWFGGQTLFDYDDAGRLTGIDRPNGVDTTFEYDADGRQTRILEIDALPTMLSDIRMSYNSRGLLSNMIRETPLVAKPLDHDLTFDYDAAQQIKGWEFDELGRTIGDGDGFWVNYDGGSRPTLFHEDLIDWWLNWDGLDNFVGWTGAGSEVELERNYAFPGAPPIQVAVDGTPTMIYVPMPDGTIFAGFNLLTNTGRYYHFDEQGSTNFVTDELGVIIARFAYDPLGALLEEDNTIGHALRAGGRYGTFSLGSGRFQVQNKGLYDTCTMRFLVASPAEKFLLYRAALHSFFDGSSFGRTPIGDATKLVDQYWLGEFGTLTSRFTPKITANVQYEYDVNSVSTPERALGAEVATPLQSVVDAALIESSAVANSQALGIGTVPTELAPPNYRRTVEKFREARSIVSILRARRPTQIVRQRVLDLVAARVLLSLALSDSYGLMTSRFLERGPSELRGALQDPASLGSRLRAFPYLSSVPALGRLFQHAAQRPLMIFLTPNISHATQE